MKIIIDDKIPYIKGVLEQFGEVVYLPGKDTTPEIVKNADAIVTRTRTKCNSSLLKDSTVKMIATATIGFDHIDTEFCKQEGIEWTNAPGCNSWSVTQYLMSALHFLAKEKELELDQLTIGIIGAGNVGSKVARFCEIIGIKVLINDPPRRRLEGDDGFVNLSDIQQNADIITLHTPLNLAGTDKTFHLVDDDFLKKCKKGVVIINSSRGEVTKTESLLSALNTGIISEVIIDCWENEPNINIELLNKAFIASPHIAGYSKDGKAKGTEMSVQALSKKFEFGIDNWKCDNVELPSTTTIEIDGIGKKNQQIITEVIFKTYPIWEDSNHLKRSVQTFEKQRGDYPVRREFPVFKIEAKNLDLSVINTLKNLGFQV